MALKYTPGNILFGEEGVVRQAFQQLNDQEIDLTRFCEGDERYSCRRTTIGGECSVAGRGTFQGRRHSTLVFKPSTQPGWWIERSDLQEQLMTPVSIRNVWTTARNIVLRSGNPHNYLRMVEHIVALRLGMGIDDLVISTDSGDPPLFDRSSLEMVEKIEQAGIVEMDEPAKYVTVKEQVTFGGSRGDFLSFIPSERGQRGIRIDCAIDFASVIGRQRVVFDLTPQLFKETSFARTNASFSKMMMVKLLGWTMADTRNLGYTPDNILIHGKKKFYGEPRFIHGDKALEPVWHRAVLDLLAAVALIDIGRFCGTIVSYRAGHTLDCRAIVQLYLRHLLRIVN